MLAHIRIAMAATAMGLLLSLPACSGGSFSGNSGSSRAAPKPATPATVDPSGTPPGTGKTPGVPSSSSSSPNPSSASADANGVGTGTSTSLGTSASGTVVPTPSNAVTAGSFTAWTDPAKPAEYQDYKIYIKVSLPTGQAALTRGDLTGDLVGTDSYTQDLADTSDDVSFSNAGNSATLVISVPGSYSGVQDTIKVHSTALNEGQNLLLTFQ